MNSYLPYFLMLILTIIAIFMAFPLRKRSTIASKVGFICWISLSAYFFIEYIVIQATTAPYDFLKQPMSDLGVTTCGSDTYALTPYEICSPYHLLMNWTFTITGIAIFVGAIFLHQFWPDKRQTKIATTLFIIYGLSYSISGIIPADVSFLWHTLGSLPGMVSQIPALILIGLAIRDKMPKLSHWTFICALFTSCALILLCLNPFFVVLTGGLLQRTLYGTVNLWMTVTAIVLWKKKPIVQQ